MNGQKGVQKIRADSIFFGRDEVAEILGYKGAKAYKIIRELNTELEAQGYQ